MTQRHPLQNDCMMFVTTNVLHRKPLFKDQAKARLAIEAMYETQTVYPFFLFGFVIMPDHTHWLISVPEEGSISRIMHRYKRSVSFQLGEGPIWQPRFDYRIIRSYRDVMRYIHMNPVKAKICENPEDYPWSSASGKWDIMELDFFGSY